MFPSLTFTLSIRLLKQAFLPWPLHPKIKKRCTSPEKKKKSPQNPGFISCLGLKTFLFYIVSKPHHLAAIISYVADKVKVFGFRLSSGQSSFSVSSRDYEIFPTDFCNLLQGPAACVTDSPCFHALIQLHAHMLVSVWVYAVLLAPHSTAVKWWHLKRENKQYLAQCWTLLRFSGWCWSWWLDR